MLVESEPEIITTSDGKQYLPVLDGSDSISALIVRLQAIREKYDVVKVFIAGDEIGVGICDVGDYTCLTVEIEEMQHDTPR